LNVVSPRVVPNDVVRVTVFKQIWNTEHQKFRDKSYKLTENDIIALRLDTPLLYDTIESTVIIRSIALIVIFCRIVAMTSHIFSGWKVTYLGMSAFKTQDSMSS
jgi:DNA integrity scanning protein DisA with diadenylate cyclase activity